MINQGLIKLITTTMAVQQINVNTKKAEMMRSCDYFTTTFVLRSCVIFKNLRSTSYRYRCVMHRCSKLKLGEKGVLQIKMCREQKDIYELARIKRFIIIKTKQMATFANTFYITVNLKNI